MRETKLLFLLVGNVEFDDKWHDIYVVTQQEDDRMYVWTGAADPDGDTLRLHRREKVLKESHSRSGTTMITTEERMLYISMPFVGEHKAQVAEMSLNGIELIDAIPRDHSQYEFCSTSILKNYLQKK